jgi:hypothetical protein
MAIYWNGTATAVVQVATTTFATYDVTTTRIVTIGGVAVSAADSGGTLTAALSAFATVLNASTHVYFAAITWTSSATQIIGTADTAGVPFTFAGSVSGGTGTLADAYTVTTASAGPNDWSTATNWSGLAVPVSTDDVIIKDNSVNICWGFAQSAVTLTSLRIEKTYTGKLGLNRIVFAQSSDASTTTSTAATEYRSTYLNIKATTVKIGEHFGAGSPAGSGRIMLDLDSTASTVDVLGTAQASSETGRPAVRLKANSASTLVFVRSAPGGVGIAVDTPGETSTVGTVSVSDPSTASVVHVGLGTTITTFTQIGGSNVLQAAATVTTCTVSGGELTTEGTHATTTVNLHGGSLTSNSTGTITTFNLNGGTADFQESNRARTVTTMNLNSTAGKGGTLKADGSVLTITTLNDASGKYTIAVS